MMARGHHHYIKEEGGLVSPTGSERAPSTSNQSQSGAAGTDTGRFARSGAPTISTTLPQYIQPGYDQSFRDGASTQGESHGDIQFLQIKPKTSSSVADNGSFETTNTTLQGSFLLGHNNALKDFGKNVKAINDALGELQARGIQHVANLPELVLIGDQSSGKSSLMSAIAGLTLPRSSGTCTRCPIHIRVSRAEEWSCRVSLKIDYEYQQRNRPITKSDVTSRDKFPPWVPLDPNKTERREFKTIRDKIDAEDVENVLRCAQLAILNPHVSHQNYIPKLKGEVPEGTRAIDLERIKQLEMTRIAQFSPNTVALEVKGPDLADLSFYDLPGVFMSAKRDEDTFLERVVSNLACDYMARPNAIILWAVPMNQDAENSYAFSLIRKMKAGKRCIGIMTKADLLPMGSSATWLAMLKGQAHQTGLGYFVTSRQGEDLEEQSKKEEAFFNRTMQDWPLEFEPFQENCGVDKLKAFLSRKLGEEFSKVLPEVKEKVHSRIAAIEEQLKAYPDPPPNPEMAIMGSLAVFSRQVTDRVQRQGFLSLWDERYMEKLKQAIISSKPKYNVRDFARVARPQAEVEIVDLCDDSPPTQPPSESRKRSISGDRPSPLSKRPCPNGSPVKDEYREHPSLYSTPPPLFNGQPARLRSRTLADIRQLIRRNAIPGQPGLVSASVYQPLFTEAAMAWRHYLERFVNETMLFLQYEIRNIMEDSFGKLMNTYFFRQSQQHMEEFVESLRVDLGNQLARLHTLESRRLFTKDEESLERNKAQEMKVLVRHRHYFRWKAHQGEEAPGGPRKIEDLTEEELAKEAVEMQKQMAKMLPDPFAQELSVVAYVRGYYLTAANRFIDNVAIHVMSGLFVDVAREIENYLPQRLGLTDGPISREMMLELVSEGPETERKRRELHAERTRLEEGMKIIEDLECCDTGSPVKSTGNGSVFGDGRPRIPHRPYAATHRSTSEYGDSAC